MNDSVFNPTTTFTVTVKTAVMRTTYSAIAGSSIDAWSSAAEAQGDTPCGITVTPAGAQ